MEATGEIRSIRFRNAEGWGIFALAVGGTGVTNVTGTLPAQAKVGDVVKVEGVVMTHPTYGKQIKANIVQVQVDNKSEAGLVRLLARLPGIGEKRAQLICQTFKGDTWQIVSEQPLALTAVKGITETMALQISEASLKFVEDMSSLQFFYGAGLTVWQTDQIIKEYGPERAIQVVKQEPYSLIGRIHGFGFKRVDEVALKTGTAVRSPSRVRAGVAFIMADSESNGGNIYLFRDQLIKIALTIFRDIHLALKLRGDAVSLADIQEALAGLVADDELVEFGGKVFSKELLLCEQSIAKF